MCKFPVKLLCKVGASTHNLSFCCQRGAKNTPTIYFTKVNMGSASQLNSGPLISVSQWLRSVSRSGMQSSCNCILSTVSLVLEKLRHPKIATPDSQLGFFYLELLPPLAISRGSRVSHNEGLLSCGKLSHPRRKSGPGSILHSYKLPGWETCKHRYHFSAFSLP